MRFQGRKEIYSSVSDINAENIIEIVEKAKIKHESNVREINYLLEYEKGEQPILNRVKEVRPEINIKVVENHASQIVNFKLSYIFGSAIRYVQKNENSGECANDLNEMCFEQSKHSKDTQLAKTMLTCGVAYRGIFQNLNKNEKSSFRLVNLDPTTTFVVYSADIFHKPLFAVTYWEEDDDKSLNTTHYTVYTDDKVYQFTNADRGKAVETINGIGCIPIIEYRCDKDKMGCFERVLDILDAINICTSDRLNGLAQFVQSFMWFNNVDLSNDQFKELKEGGALVTRDSDSTMQASIKLLESSLNQTEVQTLSDYLNAKLLEICSIPNRDSQSGSTTGQSTMLSGGWQEAEEDAHKIELMFDEGERSSLAVIKNIIDRKNSSIKYSFNVSDIDIKFTRNKIANMLVKTQGLLNMQTFGIHPRIAIKTSELFSDPQETYTDSKEYIDMMWKNKAGISEEKDLQENSEGNPPETVTEQQNEQMGYNQ